MAKLKTIMEVATRTEASWTNRQKALFHAHSRHGLVRELLRLEEIVAQTVEDGSPSPYPGFNSTDYEVMVYKLCTQKAVKRSDLWLAMWGLERRIKAAREYIEANPVTA
jgi:hypothetical protein